MGRETEAIEAFRQAITLKADYVEAYNNMAISLQKIGQAEEAIEVCRRVLAIQPTYARAYHTMGYCLHCLGRLDEAVSRRSTISWASCSRSRSGLTRP